VDYVEAGATFLDYHKPLGLIRGIEPLVDSCINLSVDDLTHLVVDFWRNRHIVKDPWFVFDYWHDNWWKEVFIEAASLCIVPIKSHILNAHEFSFTRL
jgi:hypothetical protein